MVILVAFVILLITFVPHSHSGVLQSRQEQPKSQDALQTQNQGLYDSHDKVISVTSSNIKELALGQKYATLLEFYNSFCGHCRRFAPKYKQLAEDLWPWREVLKVMAIDCAEDENNDVCREHEIMAYPTIRYFPPLYQKGDTESQISTQNLDLIKRTLVKLLANETRADESWPDFSDLSLQDSKENIFDGLPNSVQYILVIYERNHSTIAREMMLNYHKVKSIKIRRATSADVASNFGTDSYNKIAVIDRNSNLEIIPLANVSRITFKDKISSFLQSKNLYESTDSDKGSGISSQELDKAKKQNEAIIAEVKKNKHAVYQSDLEQALRFSLLHELPKYAEISGDKLLALQRYVKAVKKYNPLGESGQIFLQQLLEYVMMHNQEIKGNVLEKKIKELEEQNNPVFSATRWIGCQASKPGLRGYTCGLWQLFHFMTVQAVDDNSSSDPLEVLQAMHGYAKHFFGCSDCSNHFQEMAARRKIWNTSSKDGAVLWLWEAHNEVNQRLAGDYTEDPEFPKVQFPTKESCGECYKDIDLQTNDINWDKTQVLTFLKHIYGAQNINRFGLGNESVLPPSLEKLRQKRMISNVFSDIDMRMGIFLYIFCIGMMIVAVKLFLYKGYRKKAYAYDFLGKA